MISVNDTSFAGRKRLSATIIARTALTLEQRAQTALKAAADLQIQRRVDAVGVFLEISPSLAGYGYVLAIANYAPDGGGWSGNEPFRNRIWEAAATDHVVPDDVISMAELWYQLDKEFQDEKEFQVDDGFGGTVTDESALNKRVADLMGVDPAHVILAFLSLMEVIATRRNYDG